MFLPSLRCLACVALGVSIGSFVAIEQTHRESASCPFVAMPEDLSCSPGEGAACCSVEKPDFNEPVKP